MENIKKQIVAIIMPNYNKAKYLREAVDSVINQNFEDWKLYIIDDCSTDESIEVLEDFKKLKKIRESKRKIN